MCINKTLLFQQIFHKLYKVGIIIGLNRIIFIGTELDYNEVENSAVNLKVHEISEKIDLIQV